MGGYKGDFADSINRKYGYWVYVFEPVNRSYLECVKCFEQNEKIKCINYGISNTNGSFLISDEGWGSSLLKNNASESCEKVFLKRFDETVENFKIKHIDLMKINVEGAEFFILPHILSENLVSMLENIQIQFHTFYPNAHKLRNELRTRLLETHDEAWNYPFVWKSWTLKPKPIRPQA